MRNSILFFLSWVVFSFLLSAQENPVLPASKIKDTIRIYYDVDLKVDTAERVYKLVPKDARSRVVKVTPRSYSSEQFDVALNKENPKVKIYPVKPFQPTALNGGLLKLGYGPLYASPFLEAFYNSTRSEEMSYGVYFNHFSSKRGSLDDRNSQQGVNNLKVYGKKFFKKSTLSAQIAYRRNRYNYYGYNSFLDLDDNENVRDSLKQVYNEFNLHLNLQSEDTNSTFFYEVPILLNNVTSQNKSKELTLGTGSKFIYSLDQESVINTSVDFYFMNYSSVNNSIGRIFFSVSPTYKKRIGRISYEGGFNLTLDNDDYIGAKSFHLYPILKASFSINELKGIEAFAGLEGYMDRESLADFVIANPFVGDSTEIRNENTKIHIYGGVKGLFVNKFLYKLQIGYRKVDNLALYMNDSLLQSVYDVNYDKQSVGVFSTSFSLTYNRFRKFDFALDFSLDHYSTNSFEKAYQLPAFTTNFLTKYKVHENLNLTTDLYYISGLYAYDYASGNSVELDNILDLSVGAEYFIGKKWSVYGDFNNIINQDYSYYWQYPVKKFNFILGLTYAF